MNRYHRARSLHYRHRNLHPTRHLEPLEPRLLLAVFSWSGDIPDGTVFRGGDIQHIVGEASVAADSTLTVEPAAMIQFGGGLGLTVDGTLDARGTAEQPILITSNRDDTGFDGILGTADDVDTTGDGAGGPFQGAWRNIEFTSSSTANVLDHVEVRAGGSDFVGQLVVNGAELTLTHGVLQIATTGLRIIGGNPTIQDTSFQNHRFAAISMDLASSPEISAVTVENNGTNGLFVDGGVLTSDAVWDDPDIVYVLGGNVTVPEATVLTVSAGQIVKSPGGDAALTIEGTLLADGTAAEPIIFTYVGDDSAGDDTNNNGPSGGFQGAWKNIEFTAASTGNLMDHVEVRYGASDFVGQVVVNGSDLTFTNGAVLDGNAGVRINDSAPTIQGVTVRGNRFAALSMNLASSPDIRDVVIENNGTNGLVVDGGVLPGDNAWDDPDIVYVLGENITVPEATVLTVAAGQIVKSPGGDAALTVEGTLLADGTAAEPIIFTSIRDDSAGGDTNNNGPSGGFQGAWKNIEFTATSTGSLMDHVEVRYGASDFVGQVVVNGGELTLSNSVLRDGNQGLRITNSDPTVRNTTFLGHRFAAASMDLQSNPQFTSVTALGNGPNAVTLDSGTLSVDATWDDPDIVYMPAGPITVPEGTTLTIAAGQIIKWLSLDGALNVDGRLLANGTSDRPIIFTSSRDDSAGGDTDSNGPSGGSSRDWGQLKFSATSQGSVLDYVDVRFGGFVSAGDAAYQVWVNGGELTLNNSIIRNGIHGLRIVDSDPVITNITFLDNEFHAASMDLASNPTIAGVIADGNRWNALLVDGGELPVDSVWDDPDIVYMPTSPLTIPEGMTLTIDPGQIIKWLTLEGALNVEGQLLANGTSDQQIIFTSYRDDSAGGDTDDNGPTGGIRADWSHIEFLSTSTGNVMEYVETRYGGRGTAAAQVNVNGGEVNMFNGVVRHSAQNGLWVRNGGQLDLQNSLLFGNSIDAVLVTGGSTAVVTNNTIDRNTNGVVVELATVDLTNNLITYHGQDGVVLSQGGTINASYNDVFNPGATNYNGLDDPTGTGGNISADPKYFHGLNGQYQLRAGSPALDAGTSDGAPSADRAGNPRFDDPNVVNRGGGEMPYVDLGALERQEISTSDVDLAVVSTSGAVTGLQDDVVTVQWSSQNVGTAPALGPWRDAVYLSADQVWTPDDIFLGEASHTDDLGPGDAYTLAANVTLPGVLPGAYYFIVRANWQNEVFEGTALRNNTAASQDTIAMDLPELTVGVPVTGQLANTGEARLYKLSTAAGTSLNVSLTGPEGVGHELFAKFADVPSRQFFDFRGVRPNSADQDISIGDTLAGTYYVLVRGANVPVSETFTLTADAAGFGISDVTPPRGSNLGQVTLAVHGAQFLPGSTARLIDSSGTSIDATGVYFVDGGLLSATFDLTAAAPGLADVQVVQPGGVAITEDDAFEIIVGTPGWLATNIISPSRVRVGRGFEVLVEYTNVGDTDLVAPMFRIQSSEIAQLSLSPDFNEASQSLELIAVNPQGPAGILPPGATGRIELFGTAASLGDIVLTLDVPDLPETPIAYESLEDQMRPAGMTDEEWTPLFNQLQLQIGDTWRSYTQVLAEHASLLTPSLGHNYSVDDVYRLVVDKARGELNVSVSGQVFLREEGWTLSDAAIVLEGRDTGGAYATNSLTDGSFLFYDVVPDTYDVRLDGVVLDSPVAVEVADSDIDDLQLLAHPGNTIQGSVRFEGSDVPVRDSLVTAYTSDGGPYSTRSSQDGEFTFVGLPVGTYTVQAGDPPYVRDVVAGLELPGTNVRHVNLSLEEGSTISGRVVDAADVPLVDALVVAYQFDGALLGSSALTSELGEYTIEGLPQGEYIVKASLPGFASDSLHNVDLTAASQLDVEDIVLHQAGSLSGTVISKTTGEPVPYAVLSIQTGEMESAAATQADAAGAFDVENLMPGDYTVTVFQSDFVSLSTSANVTANEVTVLALELEQGGSVGGEVRRVGDGAPISGANIAVWAQDELVANALSDADGNYSIRELEYGSYTVTVGTPSGVAREDLTLNAASPAAAADFALEVASIQGAVLSSDEVTPLSDVEVILLQDDVVLTSTTSDENGNYVFYVVDDGIYNVTARAADIIFNRSGDLIVSVGDTLADVKTTAGDAKVEGTVIDASTGQPLVEASVFVSVGLLGTHHVLTDPLGHYEFSGPDGTLLQVVAQAGTLGFEVGTVTMSSDAVTTLDFALSPGGAVTGTVRDGQGDVLANATLYFHDAAGTDEGLFAVTDEAGNYGLIGLRPGTYDVVIYSPGSETHIRRGVTISNGENVMGFELDASSTVVSGTLRDPTGIPIGSAVVQATDSDGNLVDLAVTDGAGSFALRSLSGSTYTLTASAAGSPDETTVITIEEGEVRENVDFTITPIAFAPQTDAASAPLPAAGLALETIVAASAFPSAALGEAAASDRGVIDRIFSRFPPKRSPNELSLPPLPSGRICSRMVVAHRVAEANVQIRDLAFQGWSEGYEAGKDVASANATLLALQGAKLAGSFAKAYLRIVTILNPKIFKNLGLVTQIEGFKQIRRLDNLILKTSDLIAKSRVAVEDGKPAFSAGDLLNSIKVGRQVVDDLLEKLAGKDTAKAWGAKSDAFGLVLDVLSIIKGLYDVADTWAEAASDVDIVNSNTDNANELYIRAQVKANYAIENYLWELRNCEDGDPMVNGPEEVPLPAWASRNQQRVQSVAAIDPNDKIGTAGFAAAGYIQAGTIPYLVQFENDPDLGATLAAQEVFVTDVIDEDLDLNTLEFDSFGFNNLQFAVPPGLSHYETTLDLRPDGINLLVPVVLDVDIESRTLSATFRSLDPLTRLVPDDIDAGFLPVNDKQLHNGEGFFSYRVRPLAGLPSGTEITNQASIVFDVNEPVLTPITRHTLDVDLPQSVVDPLPELLGATEIPLTWSGSDGVGSGVAAFDVYVSTDSGPFELWLDDTTDTSATFIGEIDRSYGFYSVAADNVGLLELPPPDADATTTLVTSIWHNRDNPFDVNGQDGVSPLDALLVINELTDRIYSDPITGVLPAVGNPPPYLDVTNDAIVAPLDALLVINELPSTSGAPAAAALPVPLANQVAVQDRFVDTGRPTTAELPELAVGHRLLDGNRTANIQQSLRRTFIDAALRTFVAEDERLADELESLRPVTDGIRAAEIIDELSAAW